MLAVVIVNVVGPGTVAHDALRRAPRLWNRHYAGIMPRVMRPFGLNCNMHNADSGVLRGFLARLNAARHNPISGAGTHITVPATRDGKVESGTGIKSTNYTT
jgi:hypothetical protein